MLNLSDAERDIFMAATDESGKVRKKEFADLMKGNKLEMSDQDLSCARQRGNLIHTAALCG